MYKNDNGRSWIQKSSLFEEDGEKKYVYLLDEDMKIETIGKVSVNLAEKALAVAVNTTSYRKGAEEITSTTT